MSPSHHVLLLQQEVASANLPFNPCLSDADLAAFEQVHQVSLPVEYRYFLAHIGNGGAGPPDYGLRPLGATESWWCEAQRAAWQRFEAVRRPFPFAQPWCWEDEAEPDPFRLAAVYDGSLYLGTDGCGQDWALIITGPQRGYVWQINEAGVLPCRPAMTFGEWYARWLHHDAASATPFWWAT
jgi:hypothetical protein